MRGLFFTEFYARLVAMDKLFDNRIFRHTNTLTLVAATNGQPVGRMRHDEKKQANGNTLDDGSGFAVSLRSDSIYSPDRRVIPWGAMKARGTMILPSSHRFTQWGRLAEILGGVKFP